MSALAASLLEKVKSRRARTGVVGLGYVGLPLAVEFARAGFHATGIDLDERKTRAINEGRSYIPDVKTADVEALQRAGKLDATTDFAIVREMDTINICVPTPLRKTKDPDLSYVVLAVEAVAATIRPGQLIILESTTYPGTTEEIVLPRLVEKGFHPGEDVFVAFSPERIDPGNAKFGVRNTPKVVGGINADSTEMTVALYSSAVNHVVPVSSPTTAEMVKLLENTFRAVNIALANETALMCDKLGIDVLISLASSIKRAV